MCPRILSPVFTWLPSPHPPFSSGGVSVTCSASTLSILSTLDTEGGNPKREGKSRALESSYPVWGETGKWGDKGPKTGGDGVRGPPMERLLWLLRGLSNKDSWKKTDGGEQAVEEFSSFPFGEKLVLNSLGRKTGRTGEFYFPWLPHSRTGADSSSSLFPAT